MNAETTEQIFKALKVLVRDPKTASAIRETDPQGFRQAVSAYWEGIHAENDMDVVSPQNGWNCPGCSADLSKARPFAAHRGTYGNGPLVVCPKCGGVVNTGYGDHVDERWYYGQMFAGMKGEPEGLDLTYYDISTVEIEKGIGGVERHHGWFWTDEDGRRWIAQTG